MSAVRWFRAAVVLLLFCGTAFARNYGIGACSDRDDIRDRLPDQRGG